MPVGFLTLRDNNTGFNPWVIGRDSISPSSMRKPRFFTCVSILAGTEY
jgi:hypothetical protein